MTRWKLKKEMVKKEKRRDEYRKDIITEKRNMKEQKRIESKIVRGGKRKERVIKSRERGKQRE